MTMKIMVASDIHGSAYYGEKMMEAFAKEGADKLLLLGDLLYHGPRNDFPREYAPREVIVMLNTIKNRILAVRGNCDSEVDQMVLEFPIMADYCLLQLGRHTIVATHGHVYNATTPPPLQKRDLLLHGHTHVPTWHSFGDNNLCLNPGTISLPKHNSVNGYMIMEEDLFQWKDIGGGIYHELTANL